MSFSLKQLAKYESPQAYHETLTVRLPAWIESPCVLTGSFQVHAADHYYRLTVEVQGVLQVICQRCLEIVPYDYNRTFELAICSSDTRADQLMNQFECIVSTEGKLELVDILTDEVHLNVPEIPHAC